MDSLVVVVSLLMHLQPAVRAHWSADVITEACDQHHTRLVSIHVCWGRGQMMRVAKALSDRSLLQSWTIDIVQMPEDNNAVFAVDLDCPDSAFLLTQASEWRKFTLRNKWLLFSSTLSTVSETVENSEIQVLYPWLINLNIFPDSQVSLVTSGSAGMITLYRVGKHSVVSAARGKHRSNLQGTKLKASTVLFQLDKFKGFTSDQNRDVDTWPKLHYPIVINLVNQLNASLELWSIDDYGWDLADNGTFTGLMGQLQRREIDFAATGFFMRSDRLQAVEFTGETFHIRTTMLFRQPSLSSVSNIFVLPFSKEVWVCLIVYCLVVIIVFSLEIVLVKRCGGALDPSMRDASMMDIVSTVLGAVCQQGSHLQPKKLSGRVTIFFLSLTALFFFTSYSANIVALLQSPSSALTTLSDLVQSPLAVGIQDLEYNRVYFQESIDPPTRQLYEKKVKPLGKKAYFTPEEGVRRVRRDMFAFNVETNLGYKMISETFLETEKCSLSEIQLFPMPTLSFPLSKRSGYRDIFTQKIRWQRETGIIHRHGRLWLPERPRCADPRSGTGFVSVGLKEVLPALKVLLYGMFLAGGMFLFEVMFYHRKKRILGTTLRFRQKKKRNSDKILSQEFYESNWKNMTSYEVPLENMWHKIFKNNK